MGKNSESKQMDWCKDSGCEEFSKYNYCPLHQYIIRTTRGNPRAAKEEYRRLKEGVFTGDGKEKIRIRCNRIIYRIGN